MASSSETISNTISLESIPIRKKGDRLPLLCPSAQPDWQGAVLFGVVEGTSDAPLTGYLTEPRPITSAILELTGDVNPTEVLRIAAPCIESACRHFGDGRCTLSARTTIHLQPAVAKLPPCKIRSQCRWWSEEGVEACLRCLQIITDAKTTSESLILASAPPEA